MKIQRADSQRTGSSFTLQNLRASEHIDSELMHPSDGFKGYEKRKMIEKFLQNDEIFTKILQFISPLGISKQILKTAAPSEEAQTDLKST